MSRLFVTAIILVAAVSAQQRPPQPRNPIGFPVAPLGDGPFLIDTAEQHKIRVVVVAKGLSHPWSLAFLPDGNMLVSERPGGSASFATAHSTQRQSPACPQCTECGFTA
jgi:glucose/arabinose dehydrogenase